jgi:hypothetical protein
MDVGTCDPGLDESLLDCEDCGIAAWSQVENGRLVHEDFYVHDELWDSVCPDDEVETSYVNGDKFRNGRFVMCIGCFERRMGRKLARADFTVPPGDLFGVPPSSRFVSRWESGAGERT